MSPFRMRRHGLTAMIVLSLHLGVIWALHNSLMTQEPEVVVPVSLLAQASATSTPAGASPPKNDATRPSKQEATKTNRPAKPAAQAKSAPATQALIPVPALPITAGASASGVNTPAGTTAGSPSNTGAGSIAAASSVTAALQLPSSDADYLRNPKPVYPPLSKRMNEQGTVIHSVLIAADGRPVSAKLVKSSGFDRLDKAAYDAVMQWRYVPGKRQGVPEAMTFNVPIRWVLE